MSTLSNKRKIECLGYDLTSKRRIIELRNAIDVSKLIKWILAIYNDNHENNNDTVNKNTVIKNIYTSFLDYSNICKADC